MTDYDFSLYIHLYIPRYVQTSKLFTSTSLPCCDLPLPLHVNSAPAATVAPKGHLRSVETPSRASLPVTEFQTLDLAST